jgi:hypothetical protein
LGYQIINNFSENSLALGVWVTFLKQPALPGEAHKKT